ncbi:MAG: alanine--tRNA ligase [bacterium]
MKGRDIRFYFLEFFRKRGHTVVPSSSLVPKEDPSLLFTNAGMVQFKKVFLGDEKRDYSRAVSSQKCVRAGGKHNDLENVGWTARHHTFFEMLGNFSFGDYFKEGAIQMAWELLVGELGLPPERLFATIHEGDEGMGLGADEEARQIWLKYLPSQRIVACSTKDNFWQMGDTGPCGPCSEIVIDQGPEVGCRRPECRVGCDCDRFLELWNLVFMQYSRDEKGHLSPLPRPSIDTGMGLERITAVLQGKLSNYDTDLFQPLIGLMEELAGKKYGLDPKADVSMRVAADHARGVTFLIGDGVIPSNEGRGYVLRRIIRRAARHGKLLGLREPFLYKASQIVVEQMQEAFPELAQRKAAIEQIILKEEERFAETLDKGLRLLEEETLRLKAQGLGVLPGEVVFKLYDTYGFPVDLTADVVKEDGLEIDTPGFEMAMEQQRRRARAAWAGSGEAEVPEVYRRLVSKGIKTTFVGYEKLEARSRVNALLKDGQEVGRARPGDKVEVVTEESPFYGESGGQVGDKGLILGPGLRIQVLDTLRPLMELTVHMGTILEGELELGQEVELLVDKQLRWDTARNHSATHILQWALREILGETVHQSGSRVTPEGFRFDYTYSLGVSPQELREVERLVNQKIRENAQVRVLLMPYQEALKTGAMALFDEKYGETVRLVEMGDFSRELCGGTHVHHTGEVGFFKILSDRSISADARRMEAVTGRAAVELVQKNEKTLRDLAELFKAGPEELMEKARRVLERQKELEKQVRALEARAATGGSRDLLSLTREVAGIKLLCAEVELEDPRAMGQMGDQLRDRLGSGIVLLGSRSGPKAALTISVSRDLQERFPAGELMRQVAELVGGKGGGRPHFAQGGGPAKEKLPEALGKLGEIILERAGG